ncbi:MAG: hypothetical protein HYY06_29605 [Deltaproteobacteria bacterium]|nr:hypothetical protein [Deltaproteobacteria bacterium]
MRTGLVLALVCATRLAAAQSAAVVTIAGPGGNRAAALELLPSLAQTNARSSLERLEGLMPRAEALAAFERAAGEARAQMESFTELERAESAVAVALAAAYDALPWLDDLAVPVRLAFDLATVRLTIEDRDGAGEALALGARLDPRLACDPQVHPPAIVSLADEVRPPPDSPLPPLPVGRTRALGEALGVDTLVIARAVASGRVEVFILSSSDGQATLRAVVERGARFDARLQERLTALGLARQAPRGASDPGGGRTPGGGGTSTWLWLGPVLGAAAIAGGVALFFALPAPRDDAEVVAVWERQP